MSLSGNVEGSVELNQNRLCAYGLSKGFNAGISECINLEDSGNNKEIHATNSTTTTTSYHTTPFTILRVNLN